MPFCADLASRSVDDRAEELAGVLVLQDICRHIDGACAHLAELHLQLHVLRPAETQGPPLISNKEVQVMIPIFGQNWARGRFSGRVKHAEQNVLGCQKSWTVQDIPTAWSKHSADFRSSWAVVIEVANWSIAFCRKTKLAQRSHSNQDGLRIYRDAFLPFF